MLRIGHRRHCSPSLPFLPTARATSFALYFSFLLLVGDLVSARSEPGRPLNIDWDPAPPPDQGPPLSRGASRDKSLLGAQIGAIVGSYVLFIVILGTFLALVGRRLRADALTARGTSDIEMAGTAFQRAFDPSPISPNPSSASPGGKSAAPNFSWPSPTKQNFSGFDERIIQEDKEKRERDMERLYAAVMEHEASGGGRGGGSNTSSVVELKRYQQQKQPAPLSISKDNGGNAGLTPKLKSPSLLRALRSPKQKLSPEKQDHSRPPSFTSTSSSSRRKGSGVRGLTISGPVPTSTPTFSLPSTGAASDEESLTPRYPPPTPPPQQGQSRTTHSPMTTPPRPTTAGSSASPPPPPPSSTGSPSRRGLANRQAALPNLTIPPTSRTPPRIITTINTSSTSTSPQSKANYSSTPSSPASPTSVSSLPLRSLNNALATAAAGGMGTHHPSAHTTKLTILERTTPSPAMGGAAPRTGASMLSPGAVPYSPYMPFTPVTPITPGLVSKKDRKAREKREGRRGRLVTELVRGEDEMWDGGY